MTISCHFPLNFVKFHGKKNWQPHHDCYNEVCEKEKHYICMYGFVFYVPSTAKV